MSWIPTKNKQGARRYGCWSGNPEGIEENSLDCIAEVKSVGWMFKQCGRKRGHGRNGMLCKQHAHYFRFSRRDDLT